MRAPAVLAFFLTGTLCSALAPGSKTAPALCDVTEPAVWYKGKAEGCKFDPDKEPCIADAILNLPCGCKTATHVAQPVATICPEYEGQRNCHTGFMYTATATNCP